VSVKPPILRAPAPALLAAIALALLAAPAQPAAPPVKLETTEIGQGPTIVLVHQLGGRRLMWMPVAKKLMSRYHVVMVDLPGHGDSPMPDPFTFQTAAAALDPVIARFNPESTVVVGHGVGGLVALSEAGAHPERMKGLVVIAIAAHPEKPIPDQQQKLFFQMLDEHYEEFIRNIYVQMARDSAQGAAMNAQAALVPKVTMRAWLSQLLVSDLTDMVKKLKVPLLYVGSEKQWPADQAWPEFAKRYGYDQAPQVSWRRIGASGNYVPLDQPDSLATAIAEFAGRSLEATAKK
jgi:pimeloyl-ACP methyl ester carboxylesterase